MFKYRPKALNQLHNWYSQKASKGKNGFYSFDEFKTWYDSQKKTCNYCGISEEECQEIIMSGLLKSKRFPKDGIPGPGTSRGVWLEVDRKDSNLQYTTDNCVLCCYFCNNDKSDIFNEEQYREFLYKRSEYLKGLL